MPKQLNPEQEGYESKEGNGRRKAVRIEENIVRVKEFILTQENKPKTHEMARRIA